MKALIYTNILPSKPLLISASADSSVIIWNPRTGERYHTLKGHVRGVQSLAIDPVASTTERIVLYSGGSNREIKRWFITATSAKEDKEGEILQHETSLNQIRFLGDEGEPDMWTASSDTTVKRFERQELDAKNGKVQADTVLDHSDFANDVVMDQTGQWIATACSDEEIRIWNAGVCAPSISPSMLIDGWNNIDVHNLFFVDSQGNCIIHTLAILTSSTA